MKNTKKLILSALFAALCLVSTMVFAFPLPVGYANLGDCFAFMAGFVLGMPWGVAAAGIGIALADLLSGYAVYIPATFVIKALIAFFGALCAKILFGRKHKNVFAVVVTVLMSLTGEVLMVGGYFVFEYFLIGVGEAALVSIPGNLGQAVTGMAASFALAMLFYKNRKLSSLVSARADNDTNEKGV